jgi:hypothetical protein
MLLPELYVVTPLTQYHIRAHSSLVALLVMLVIKAVKHRDSQTDCETCKYVCNQVCNIDEGKHNTF